MSYSITTSIIFGVEVPEERENLPEGLVACAAGCCFQGDIYHFVAVKRLMSDLESNEYFKEFKVGSPTPEETQLLLAVEGRESEPKWFITSLGG